MVEIRNRKRRELPEKRSGGWAGEPAPPGLFYRGPGGRCSPVFRIGRPPDRVLFQTGEGGVFRRFSRPASAGSENLSRTRRLAAAGIIGSRPALIRRLLRGGLLGRMMPSMRGRRRGREVRLFRVKRCQGNRDQYDGARRQPFRVQLPVHVGDRPPIFSRAAVPFGQGGHGFSRHRLMIDELGHRRRGRQVWRRRRGSRPPVAAPGKNYRDCRDDEKQLACLLHSLPSPWLVYGVRSSRLEFPFLRSSLVTLIRL